MSNEFNPLESIIFINLPENFSLSAKDFTINPSIPLPVQTLGRAAESTFDPSELTGEMIFAGILTLLAYESGSEHMNYYRSLLTASRPEIKAELTEAAVLKARNEDFDIAEEIFAALRGLDPDDTAAVLNSALFYDQRAESYRRSGLHEDADACDDKAHMYYKRVLADERPVPDAFFNAGFFYLKQKNFSRARECFESFLAFIDGIDEKEMDENTLYKKQRAAEIVRDISSRNLEDELFKSAFDFISMGQEEKGLESIRQFIEKNPKVWNAWFMLGWALRRMERWSDAKNAFLQAASLGGENTDTYNELAICNMELGEFAESRTSLYEALRLEPENTKIMSNLGFLALKEGDPEQARRFFTAVLEFDPKDKIAIRALEDLE